MVPLVAARQSPPSKKLCGEFPRIQLRHRPTGCVVSRRDNLGVRREAKAPRRLRMGLPARHPQHYPQVGEPQSRGNCVIEPRGHPRNPCIRPPKAVSRLRLPPHSKVPPATLFWGQSRPTGKPADGSSGSAWRRLDGKVENMYKNRHIPAQQVQIALKTIPPRPKSIPLPISLIRLPAPSTPLRISAIALRTSATPFRPETIPLQSPSVSLRGSLIGGRTPTIPPPSPTASFRAEMMPLAFSTARLPPASRSQRVP